MRGPADFRDVVATQEEVAAYVAKSNHRPAVGRAVCVRCGTRIWKSGLGVGAHRRACKGPLFVKPA